MIFFPKIQIIELESMISIIVHTSANPCPLSYNKPQSSGFRPPTQHSAVFCLVRKVKQTFTIQTLSIRVKVCLGRSYSIRCIVLLAYLPNGNCPLYYHLEACLLTFSHIYVSGLFITT